MFELLCHALVGGDDIVQRISDLAGNTGQVGAHPYGKIAAPDRDYPAALIVPNWDTLRSYAQLKQIDAKTPAEMCRHPRILDLMQRQIDAQCGELSKYERVKKVALLENEFTIEGGEMTPTLKIKRRVVDEKYRSVIDKLYEETAEPSQD